MNSSVPPIAKPQYLACQDCDQLLQIEPISPKQRARCPRCGAKLEGVAVMQKNQLFGLPAAIAGLIVFFPAISLPMMEFELIGQRGTNTLWQGVLRLWEVGFPLLSLLVLLCSLLAPLLHLLLTSYLAQQLRRSRPLPDTFPSLLNAMHFFQPCSPVEVYALRILVAYITLLSDGEVVLLHGRFCIAALLFCLVLSSQLFHTEQAWRTWEAQQNGQPL